MTFFPSLFDISYISATHSPSTVHSLTFRWWRRPTVCLLCWGRWGSLLSWGGGTCLGHTYKHQQHGSHVVYPYQRCAMRSCILFYTTQSGLIYLQWLVSYSVFYLLLFFFQQKYMLKSYSKENYWRIVEASWQTKFDHTTTWLQVAWPK